MDYPELGWYVWKSTLLFEVSGALTMVHENLSEIISHQVVPITAMTTKQWQVLRDAQRKPLFWVVVLAAAALVVSSFLMHQEVEA